MCTEYVVRGHVAFQVEVDFEVPEGADEDTIEELAVQAIWDAELGGNMADVTIHDIEKVGIIGG